MRPLDLARSASFRMALAYAALFSASVFVLFVVIYLATAGYASRQLAGAIDDDIDALRTEFLLGGRANLIVEIVSRIDGGRFYLLQTVDGRVLAGNTGPLPIETGWIDIPSEGRRAHVLAHAIRLPDASLLLAGRDATRLDELQRSIAKAFGWGLGATLILAILGAVLMGVLAVRRVDVIGRTMAEIVAGRLDRRIPIRGTGDEFDRLATLVNHMLERIQSLMGGLQQVSNDIAHDLKTPLTRMRQRLELAAQGNGDIGHYRSAIGQAIEQCDQTLRVFDALLRIAQIEAGTRRAGFRLFALSAVAETIVETYQPVAEEADHDLTAAIEPGLALTGDQELITQMLSNLVENAIRHTPSGCRIDVGLRQDGDHLVLTVSDNGPGIAEDERPKVFRRFYRLEASRSTAGSGLGLALVSAVAQLHDAVVELSDAAPGLRVTVLFEG